MLGTYTDRDGGIPYETEEFFEQLDKIDFNGKPAALFGSCDSFYPHCGGAVDQFETKLAERGAFLPFESLKIKLLPEKSDEVKCEEFARQFSEALANQIGKVPVKRMQ